MPNLKKEAVLAVIKKLRADQEKMRWAISDNRGKFMRLVEEQTVLKRQLAVIGELIRGLE